MCTHNKNTDYDVFSTNSYVGQKSFVMSSRGKTRAADDSFVLVACEHHDGRCEVHLLAPRDALTSEDEVTITPLQTWASPAYQLCAGKVVSR